MYYACNLESKWSFVVDMTLKKQMKCSIYMSCFHKQWLYRVPNGSYMVYSRNWNDDNPYAQEAQVRSQPNSCGICGGLRIRGTGFCFEYFGTPWAGILSRYRDSLRAVRSGDRIPVEARFSAPIQTGPRAHPASCIMGTGSFLGVKAAGAWRWPPTPI